jgi:hypothetical protein
MMGMRDSAYHLSWFIFYILNVIFVSVVMTIISALTFLKHSQFVLLFFRFFFYGCSLFGYVMCFIAVFKEVKTAIPVFFIIQIIMFEIRWAMPPDTPTVWRVITTFIPNLAVNNWGLILFYLEEQG